jgi:hypothetical protein
MPILTFTYTKDTGEVSNRTLFALEQPGAKYFGIDMSELDLEDQVAFSVDMDKIEEEKQQKIKDLMAQYDIKHSFRTFLPSKMSDVTIED